MALSVASLVSYWRLDETTGSRSDGYGSNTLTANGTTSYTTGKRGNAVSLNGTTGNYLSVASNSGLQTGNQDFCVSLWVNFQATGTKVFMAKAGGAGGNEFSLAIDVSDNKIWFVYWNSGPQIVKSPSTVTTNTWYHVVAWCDTGANTINLCVNNGTVQSATRTSNTSNGTAPFAIGGYSDGSYPINGYVDEVALWKAVPTSGDIAYLYGSGSPPSYLALTDNLLGFWEFDEASGSTAADATGNGNTATAGGTVTIASGKMSNAREFKGAGYMTATGTILNSIGAKFSAAGWCRFYTVSGTYSGGVGSSTYRNCLRCDDGVVSNSGFIMRAHSSGYECYIGNGSAYNGHEVAGSFTTNTWYYIGLTYDASVNTFIQYVNGAAVYTNTGASWGNMTHPGTGTIPFFGRAYNGTEYMDGLLDSWGVWSRVLSSTEMSTLYNGGSGIAYPFSSSSFTPPQQRRNLVPLRRSYNW